MQSDRTEATGKENKTLIEKISETNGSTSQHVAVSSDCEMKMDVSHLVDEYKVPHDSKGHGEETLKSESKTKSLNDAQSPDTSINDSLQSGSIDLYLSSSNESLNKEVVSQKVPVKKNELCKEQRRFSLDAARLTLKEFFEFPEDKRSINSDFEVGMDMKDLFSNISIPSDIADFMPPRYVESSYVGAHESCDSPECLCKEYDDTSKNTKSVQSPRRSPSYSERATQENVGKRKYNEDNINESESMCLYSLLSLNPENQIVTSTNSLTYLQPLLTMDGQNNDLNLELLASSVLDFQQSNENLPNRDSLPCFEHLWDEIKDYASENRSMTKNSLPDDEFFEADRYTGDKGKQPASKKYAYKKKSKSSQQTPYTSEGESAEKSNSESAWDFPGTSGINFAALPSTAPGSPESKNIPCLVPKEDQSDHSSYSRFETDKRVTVSGWNGRLNRQTTHQLSRQTSSDSTTAENGEGTPPLPLYEDVLNLDSTDEGKQLQIALLLSLQDVKTTSSDEDS